MRITSILITFKVRYLPITYKVNYLSCRSRRLALIDRVYRLYY